jgi:hypothetical protein
LLARARARLIRKEGTGPQGLAVRRLEEENNMEKMGAKGGQPVLLAIGTAYTVLLGKSTGRGQCTMHESVFASAQ